MTYDEKYKLLKQMLLNQKRPGIRILLTPYNSNEPCPFLYGHIIKAPHILYVQYSPLLGGCWEFSYEYKPSAANGNCCAIGKLPADLSILTPDEVDALCLQGFNLMHHYGAEPHKDIAKFIENRLKFEEEL